ncbi:MAG TPA: ABC transporter substrate-binding protein [Nocardioidaceae bacterium]|nr:ABC transporter substrate-binding protein [Nocardioidaceae bacterium]
MMRPVKMIGALLCVGALVSACADVPGEGGGAAGGKGVAIAQVVPTLGYVTLDTARAFNTFADEGIEAEHVQLSGGDPAALAALDSGDVDFAAVGSEAPLLALAEGGGDYQVVYSLMGQMSLDLVVSKAFMDKAGVSPTDPLEERLAALEGARFGVSALGGAQERTSKWLAQQGGLDPEEDIEVLNAGPPPALLAGMDNDRIDAFLLTAPNGAIAEKAGYGQVLVRLAAEVDELAGFDHLVLVTRKDFAAQEPEKVTKVVRALNSANEMILDQPGDVAAKLQSTAYEDVPTDIMTESVQGLAPGVQDKGAVTEEGMSHVIEFTAKTGEPTVRELEAASGEGDWWTNQFVQKAG